ncbi:hypothetical protein [Mycoplasmopsis glycophila]|uniref:Transglutaminase-like domain-containing protein n=1 Tax=Mycoplasmopsis glycophila TaxID=171285 RepID=A0A449AU61_9BACT|nr:hypothetical protein [Mycoplasmopsis glycophila]VEU70022.1 Uncharacterised protein [Mycoplasmopsis glycophila]
MAMTLLGISVRLIAWNIYNRDDNVYTGQHAWNEMYIDGRWKVVDWTWADKTYFMDESYYKKVKK